MYSLHLILFYTVTSLELHQTNENGRDKLGLHLHNDITMCLSLQPSNFLIIYTTGQTFPKPKINRGILPDLIPLRSSASGVETDCNCHISLSLMGAGDVLFSVQMY